MKAVEDIKRLLEEREAFYSRLHQEQKTDAEYYELTFKAGVPENLGITQRTPPTARKWVDVGVNHFTLDNPRARVISRGESDTARAKDSVVESFLNFWLRQIITQIKDAARKLLCRGQIFFSIGIDDRYLGVDMSKMSVEEVEEFEEKRLRHFPLRVTVVDPINAYPSMSCYGFVPSDFIESYNITVGQAQYLCEQNNWKWKTDKKSTEFIPWISYVSPDSRCFLLDGKPVLKPAIQPNVLKFCPYVLVPAGFGIASHEGKPEYEYRSIIYPIRQALKLQARVFTQVDSIASRLSWGWIKIRGRKEDVERLYPGGQITLEPFTIIREIPGEVEVSIESGESPPTGLLQQLAMIGDIANPPSILGGVRPAGVYSAQGLEDLFATAKPLYKSAFKNLEDGLAVLMSMGLRIIDKVYGHDVGFRDFSLNEGRSIKKLRPSDIDGHYDCEVQLLAEPPEASDIKKTMGTNFQKAGVISHLYNLVHYHDLSLEEALNEIAQIYAEQAMKQQGMLEATARDALKRLGMKQVLEELETELGKVTGPVPPRRLPATFPMGGKSVRQRPRTTPGIEAAPTPQEIELEQRGGYG